MGVWDTIKGYGNQAVGLYKKYTPAGQALNYLGGGDERLDAAEGRYPMQDRSAYDMPGYQGRASSLAEFAANRGGGQFQDQQAQLANELMSTAQGKNSYARAQLGQDLSRLQSQQQSMAAGARPSQANMASRLAMQNSGQLGASMAGQSQLAAIAERNAAAQAAGNVLGQGRQQDIGAYLGAQNLGIQNALGQQAGTFQYGQSLDNRFGAAMGQPTQGERMFGLLKGAGEAFVSDYRNKQNIRELGPAPTGLPSREPMLTPDQLQSPMMQRGGFSKKAGAGRFETRNAPFAKRDDAEAFLNVAMKPYAYDYKPGLGLPPGHQVGPMAQNIERVAPDAVENTPRGKAVLVERVVPRLMAAGGLLNKKVEALRSAIAMRGR